MKMMTLPRSSAKTEARGEYIGVGGKVLRVHGHSTDLMVCKKERKEHPGRLDGIADPHHLVLAQPNHIAVAITVWAEREDFQRFGCGEDNH